MLFQLVTSLPKKQNIPEVKRKKKKRFAVRRLLYLMNMKVNNLVYPKWITKIFLRVKLTFLIIFSECSGRDDGLTCIGSSSPQGKKPVRINLWVSLYSPVLVNRFSFFFHVQHLIELLAFDFICISTCHRRQIKILDMWNESNRYNRSKTCKQQICNTLSYSGIPQWA